MVSDGGSAQKDNGKINRGSGWAGEEGERAHATLKCISGDTHPVRWNWTL